MTKLTKPQMLLLREIAEGQQSISESYTPANRLTSLGFAEMIPGRFGGCTIRITNAGRKALRESVDGK